MAFGLSRNSLKFVLAEERTWDRSIFSIHFLLLLPLSQSGSPFQKKPIFEWFYLLVSFHKHTK
jgi:hypothetical protein